MNLTRYVPTRLLEAVLREVRACFARELTDTEQGRTLAELYAGRVIAYAALPAQKSTPWQIEVSLTPVTFEQGTSAVNNLQYQARVTFYYPADVGEHAPGTNSVWDHPFALRDWLFDGGTWKARVGAALQTRGSLEDPQTEGVQIGRLDSVQIGEVEPGPDSATNMQTLIAVYDTRETDRGGLK